jgi:hypothetical protein
MITNFIAIIFILLLIIIKLILIINKFKKQIIDSNYEYGICNLEIKHLKEHIFNSIK